MKAVYTKPKQEVYAVAVETGYTISQHDEVELAPTTDVYSDKG